MPEAGTPVGIRGWYPPGNWIYCMIRPTEDNANQLCYVTQDLCHVSPCSAYCTVTAGIFFEIAFFTLGFRVFGWKNRPGLIHSV